MAGRKNKYELKVKPKFEKISEALAKGATEKQVAEKICGIGYSTFNTYKKNYPELAELLQNVDRSELIEDLKSALVRKALGYTYQEKKEYISKDKNGKEVKRVEISTKVSHPDVAAINLALKNFDRERWSNDWQAYDLKKKEYELRKQIAESREW